ncbi:hypothetical protein HD806DRAFT_547284 [Xylariaceae sp. AK1471]|nr:hypothetical protein HD806DRAFT_547284 [Xylariaceae sp. AK1471]
MCFSPLFSRRNGPLSDIPHPFNTLLNKLSEKDTAFHMDFIEEYQKELESLRHEWELRIFRHATTCSRGLLYSVESNGGAWIPPKQAMTVSSRGFTASLKKINAIIQDRKSYLEYWGNHMMDREEAIKSKTKIDAKWRPLLGLQACETIPRDFPISLDQLVSLWRPWYDVEDQPCPHVRLEREDNTVYWEYYSSDRELQIMELRYDSHEVVMMKTPGKPGTYTLQWRMPAWHHTLGLEDFRSRAPPMRRRCPDVGNTDCQPLLEK